MTTQSKILILLSSALAALSGCKKPSTGELEVKTTISQTYALPVTINSCVDENSGGASSNSLSAVSADFGKIDVRWKGRNDMVVKYIHVSLTGTGLTNQKFVTDIAGEELKQIFSDKVDLKFPGTTNPGSVVEDLTECSIRVGGMTFQDPEKPSSAFGTITIVGLETNSDGQSVPVTADFQVALDYPGKP